ncbi:MAG TPA: hypothetical protein DHV77_02205 [Erysipelotrichaceae bacterium]|nr:hypothetical protein [Erysipelotrichaceae bacterium]
MKTCEEMTERVFSRIQEYERRKKEKKQIFYKIGALVAVYFVIFVFALSSVFPVYARRLPFIGEAFAYIQDHLDFMGLYSQYAYHVGDTSKNAGVGITLSEVYCDGENLFISYLLESEKFTALRNGSDYNEKQLLCESKAYYEKDGKKILLNSNGLTGLEGSFIDNKTFAGVEIYCMNQEGFPDEFTLDIVFESIGENRKISGKWDFYINVQCNREDVKVYEVGVEKEGHRIDRIVVSPVMISVYTSYPDLYSGTVRYQVHTYSDLSPECDISKMGEYAATSGIDKIPRDRVDKWLDIYVLDSGKVVEHDKEYMRDVIEKYAIVSYHIDLQ